MFENRDFERESLDAMIQCERVYEVIGFLPRSFYEGLTPKAKDHFAAPKMIMGKPSTKKWDSINGAEVEVFYGYDPESGKLVSETWVEDGKEENFDVRESRDIDAEVLTIRTKVRTDEVCDAGAIEEILTIDESGKVHSLEFNGSNGMFSYNPREKSLHVRKTSRERDGEGEINSSEYWEKIL